MNRLRRVDELLGSLGMLVQANDHEHTYQERSQWWSEETTRCTSQLHKILFLDEHEKGEPNFSTTEIEQQPAWL